MSTTQTIEQSTYQAIANKAAQYRAEGKRIVFTNGCFDILHVGHVSYLNSAKALGDVLILGLNSDESVRRLKGQERPLNTQDDRAHVLAGLRAIDDVVIFAEDTPFALIQAIQPDVLAKGGDYTIDSIVGADIVQARGGEVVVIPFVAGKSTTAIVERIKSLG
jgi:rfaE bifunctional protein nucleotidyltransferase chain/domain